MSTAGPGNRMPGPARPCRPDTEVRALWQGLAIQVTLPLSAIDDERRCAALDRLPGADPSWSRARQISFVGGRLCAEAAVASLTGQPASVGRSDDGLPLWPAGLSGSIAHDAHTAMAVVARRSCVSRVGIDVERLLDADGRDDVSAVCFTANERHLNERHASPCLDATLRFSAKEAYFKAAYPAVQRFVEFHEVDVIDDGLLADRGVFAIQPVEIGDLPAMAGAYCRVGGSVVTLVYQFHPDLVGDGRCDGAPWQGR